MKTKTTLAVLALVLAPSLALACPMKDGKQAMSCAEGHMLDAQTGTCVPQTTS